jgi:acyl-CoA hydrolase
MAMSDGTGPAARTAPVVSAPERLAGFDAAVEATFARVGRRVLLGAPLAIGKPNGLINAFYRRASADPTVALTIFTALSLARPKAKSFLEARFLDPFVAREYAGYEELLYVEALRRGTVPANVAVHEFYLLAGSALGVAPVQQGYFSSNYTHVSRDLAALGLNVIVQQVAVREDGDRRAYSLSSNPDLTLDLLAHFAAARAAGLAVAFVAVVNRELPFMPGVAEVPESSFDFLVDGPAAQSTLFSVPSAPLATVEYAIGLNASALIADGGTLELGIGELGAAVAHALKLRHQRNGEYRQVLAALGTPAQLAGFSDAAGLAPFSRGLYGCTELLVDGFLELYHAGILKRAAYGEETIQRLADRGLLDEHISEQTLAALADAGLAQPGPEALERLARAGLFRSGTRTGEGFILAPDGTRLAADFADPANRRRLAELALAESLPFAHAHAAFFLGPTRFYRALRELPESLRARFVMDSVCYTNQLYGGDLPLRIAQRQQARFLNTAMMMTLLGAAVSDALADGQVVSGVGGQYNFVAMAHELPGGRALMLLRSTREKAGTVNSNLLWSYGHTTIPRHLRDVAVTEYGIADLRGRSDRDTIAALLELTDARFQDGLIAQAVQAGKLEAGYRPSERARGNTPARLEAALAPLRSRGLFPDYPFGSDFTPEEEVLVKALRHLERETARPVARLRTLAKALAGLDAAGLRPYLSRMGLEQPRSLREHLYARLLAHALRAVTAPQGAS